MRRRKTLKPKSLESINVWLKQFPAGEARRVKQAEALTGTANLSKAEREGKSWDELAAIGRRIKDSIGRFVRPNPGKLFTLAQLAEMRRQFATTPERMSPDSPTLDKMRAMIKTWDDDLIEQVISARIKWVSSLASVELARRRVARKQAQFNPSLGEWDESVGFTDDDLNEASRLGSQMARALGRTEREGRSGPKFYHVTWYSKQRNKRTGFIRPIEAHSASAAVKQAKAMIENDRTASNFVAKEARHNPENGYYVYAKMPSEKTYSKFWYASELLDAAKRFAASIIVDGGKAYVAPVKRKPKTNPAGFVAAKQVWAYYATPAGPFGLRFWIEADASDHNVAVSSQNEIASKYKERLPLSKVNYRVERYEQRPISDLTRYRGKSKGGPQRNPYDPKNRLGVTRRELDTLRRRILSAKDGEPYNKAYRAYRAALEDAGYSELEAGRLADNAAMVRDTKPGRRNPDTVNCKGLSDGKGGRLGCPYNSRVSSARAPQVCDKCLADSKRLMKRNPAGKYSLQTEAGEWLTGSVYAKIGDARKAAQVEANNRGVTIWVYGEDGKGYLRPVKGGRIAPKLKASTKRNPSTREMSERFNGKASGRVAQLKASSRAPGDLSRAGKLVFLKLVKMGRQLRIPGAVVCIDPKTEKLWIAGNRAPLLNKKAKPGEVLDFGEIEAICYETAKAHIGSGKRFEYVHRFGEDGGKRPRLHIDAEGMPLLSGGDYQIRREGIVN